MALWRLHMREDGLLAELTGERVSGSAWCYFGAKRV